MMFHFQLPAMLWLAGLVPAVLWLAWWQRRPTPELGLDGRAWARRHQSTALEFWRPQVFLVAGVLLLTMALARPAWRLEPEPVTQTRRDVVFVLDVSNSMLATDRTPNRLEDARVSIRETVDRLPGSDRVALVLFAGSNSIACPLTEDRRFFFEQLAAAGPARVVHGGTRIGDALRKVADFVLEPGQGGFHDVILITDGGDHGSEPLAAVTALNQAAAGLVVVGLGDPVTGTRIPDPYAEPGEPAGFLEHEGAEVWVPMEPQILEAMAQASDRGLWLKAGAGPYDLASTYMAFLQQAPRLEIELPDVSRWRDEFLWFLLFGMLSLLAASRVVQGRNLPAPGNVPAPNPGAGKGRRLWQRQGSVTGLLVGVLLLTSADRDRSTDEPSPEPAEGATGDLPTQWRRGHDLMAAGRYADAAQAWRSALAQAPRNRLQRHQHSRLLHNAGVALAQQAQQAAVEGAGAEFSEMQLLQQASDLFLEAARLDPRDRASAGNLLWSRQRLHSLREAERAASEGREEDPTDPDGDADGGEGEESEGDPVEGDEADADEEQEAGDERTGDPSMTTVTDLDNRGLPPPGVSPEDIIREELEIQRERERPRRPSSAVERDW